MIRHAIQMQGMKVDWPRDRNEMVRVNMECSVLLPVKEAEKLAKTMSTPHMGYFLDAIGINEVKEPSHESP